MTTFRRNFFLSLVALLGLWTRPLPSQQVAYSALKVIPSCPCYSIQVGPLEQTVKIGEPIKIDIVVTNIANHDIYIQQNSRQPGDVYFVDVKDTSGVRQRMTARYSEITDLLHAKEAGQTEKPRAFRGEDGTVHLRTYGGSGEPLRILKPSDKAKVTVLINDLYKLDKFGTYSIQLKRMEWKEEIDSNVVTVKITN